jgi:hypothetical protein
MKCKHYHSVSAVKSGKKYGIEFSTIIFSTADAAASPGFSHGCL